MKRHAKKKTQDQESREMLATVHAIVLTATLASPKVPITAMEAGVLRRQRARIRTAIHSSGRPRWRDLHTAAKNFAPFVGIDRRAPDPPAAPALSRGRPPVGHPSATPIHIVAAIVQCGEDACRCYHGVVRIYDRVAWVSRTWPRIGEDPQRLIAETRAYIAGWRADGYAVDDSSLEAFARANPPPNTDRKNLH